MVENIVDKKDLKLLDNLNDIKNFHNEILNNHFSDLSSIDIKNNININTSLLTPNYIYEKSLKNKIINIDKLNKVDD